MERRIITTDVLEEDVKIEGSLRPQRLDDYIGHAVVEIIYNWPGMGNMAVKAISCRDYPLVQGYVLWIAILYMCINLLVDLSYTYLDPRLKEDR